MGGLLMAVVAIPARAADVGPDPKDVKAMADKAYAFLSKSQGEDGSFSPRLGGPGVTALVVAGMLRNGVSADDPVVKKAMAYLEKSIQKDGGIYDKRLANYTTSVAVLAFAQANKGGKYDTVIKNAVKFLSGIQFGDPAKQDDPNYGGSGYDAKSRPDMSNTQMMVEALAAAGVPKDDPALKRAVIFITHCQNLYSEEANTLPFAKKTTEDDKGGMVYTPVVNPKDKDAQTPQGGLRSRGAMTYGGLKSFLYAGVKKDDPRVQGALKYIRKHYTLAENPGMGTAGLYYYYHTFAKAMKALGEDNFTDADGKKHDWRKDLFEALKKRQQENGSFINKGERTFGEGDPNLATAFALLSLSYCTPAK
jgi:squalene-hopene/tetraprenyl-beta-curcumene cyclase